MRVKEFLLKQNIFEVSMKPSILQQEAAKTNAIAGMEFEMIIPNLNLESGEYDLDIDEEIKNIDHISSFFASINPQNRDSRSSIRGLTRDLTDEYDEWLSEIWDNDKGRKFFNDYALDYYDESEAIDRIEKEYDLEDEDDKERNRLIEKFLKIDKERFLDDLWDDQGSIYEGAKREWIKYNGPDFSDFLAHKGYTNMYDLPWQDYDLEWPSTSAGLDDLVDLSKNFGKVIGKPVNYSLEYHKAERNKNSYAVEPDGSLEPDNDKDYGLEFISPPMPIDAMLNDLKKVTQWAKSIGAYTNSSTGLHMNVSIPGLNAKNIDYIKLALLLGDQYVLSQFQREANSYAKSSFQRIQKNILTLSLQDIEDSLNNMRNGMAREASELVTNMVTGNKHYKYVSIHMKEDYIEFRSPGGDWLNSDFSKLENTLLRFVVALSASMDPNKYRQEYLKKFYSILKPATVSDKDPITMFAKYSAGDLSKLELKQWVSELRGKSTEYWFKVEPISDLMKRFPLVGSIEVVARTHAEAKQKARNEWVLGRLDAPDHQLKATPIQKANPNPNA